MLRAYSTAIFVAGVVLALAGCATVASTSIFYTPLTTRIFPPKPNDYPIPILGKNPDRPFKVIGRFTFKTARSWRFVRDSLLFNARQNGADAVVLRNVDQWTDTFFTEIPARMDWIPQPRYFRTKNGIVRCGTAWVPVWRPGSIQRFDEEITTVDAEMVVFTTRG